MDTRELESSQHYGEESPYLNPSDHPAETRGEEERELVRGDCRWYDGKYCNNEDVFVEVTEVSGAYCSLCEEWEPVDE